MLDERIFNRLQHGCVIPAHPLALTDEKKLDERHQRALTRYYLAAGAGGLAVGVHTTQFAIHEPRIGLYRPVLELAAETAQDSTPSQAKAAPIMIAGLVGETKQAVREAELASDLGYHLGLLSLTALRGRPTGDLIAHAERVAEVIPVMGFYLQPAISGMTLPQAFWSKLVQIRNVRAIKIAPFNRYCTLDVLEAVAKSGRHEEIALYTGNDDHIVGDLVGRHVFATGHGQVTLRVAGGLLGQWACWTKRAVEGLEEIRLVHESDAPIPAEMLTRGNQLTLANKAIFDADHAFRGCIPGISYVLKRQGLMTSLATLDPNDRLSSGQADRIEKIVRRYPHLTDDEFVAANASAWLDG
jgi:dihydrodipicolinate synthase/N-acetylneuraminate lyase